jgi:hypothetical protein
MRTLLFHQVEMLHTADDTDDGQPLPVTRDLNAPAERITRGPVTTRERFINDRDEW